MKKTYLLIASASLLITIIYTSTSWKRDSHEADLGITHRAAGELAATALVDSQGSDEWPLNRRIGDYSQRFSIVNGSAIAVVDEVKGDLGTESIAFQCSANYSVRDLDGYATDKFVATGSTSGGQAKVVQYVLVESSGSAVVSGSQGVPSNTLTAKVFRRVSLYEGELQGAPVSIVGDPDERYALLLTVDENAIRYLYRLSLSSPGDDPELVWDSVGIPALRQMSTLSVQQHTTLGRVVIADPDFDPVTGPATAARAFYVDSNNDGVFDGAPYTVWHSMLEQQDLLDPAEWSHLRIHR